VATASYHHKTPQEVATTLHVISKGESVELELHVTNNTAKDIELRFPNSKTHDFVVQDTSGRIVWRSSDGRFFTQIIQNKTIRVKNSLTLADEWNPRSAHGIYIAIATLNTSSHPVERRIAFTLP
jgi:hypothetical protein